MPLAQKIIAALIVFPCSCFANALELQLMQYADTDCNGRLSVATTIQPGSCIHYQIRPQPVGDAPLFDVVIKALIPEHTYLFSADPSNNPVWQTLITEDEIHFHIAELTTDTRPILGYTVKIDSNLNH